MQETRVPSLGQEDPLEKVAMHSGTLAWRIHEGRSRIGYSPWGHRESDTTEQLHKNTRTRMQTITCRIDTQQVLLCSTGNCAQYPEINHNGKEYMCVCVCVCVCITESLYCMAEIHTTL